MMVANLTKAQMYEVAIMVKSAGGGFIRHQMWNAIKGRYRVESIYDSYVVVFDDLSVMVMDKGIDEETGVVGNLISTHERIGMICYMVGNRLYPDKDSFDGDKFIGQVIRVRVMENDVHRFQGESTPNNVIMATSRVVVTYHPYDITVPYRLTTTNSDGKVIFQVVTDSFAKITLYWNWEVSRAHGLTINGYCHINDNQ